MPTGTIEEAIHTLHICKQSEIAAPIDVTFDAVLEQLGPASTTPDGTPMSMRIEPWPGGRWFRDLGDNTGHLWGHVQVIKPPALIELRGPMFMSYPAVNFVQYRLSEQDGGTHLQITHRAFGQIPEEHREGVNKGWDACVETVRQIAGRPRVN